MIRAAVYEELAYNMTKALSRTWTYWPLPLTAVPTCKESALDGMSYPHPGTKITLSSNVGESGIGKPNAGNYY